MLKQLTEETPIERDWRKLLSLSYSRKCHKYDMVEGVRFTEEGLQCLSQIAGFIRGLALTDQDMAMHMSHDLLENLRYLGGYAGKMTDKGPLSAVPSYQVLLHHDGTFGGFGVLWYRAVNYADCTDDGRRKEGPGGKDLLKVRGSSDRTIFYSFTVGDDDIPRFCDYGDRPYHTAGINNVLEWGYEFAWNGAMLYRGPGGGEVFSVQLTGNRPGQFWSIHT